MKPSVASLLISAAAFTLSLAVFEFHICSADKMREEYPAYPDHELLLYLLAQALTNVSERKPLP